MSEQSLAAVVAAKPYPQFAGWWPIRSSFLACMAPAIVTSWQELPGNTGDLGVVRGYVAEYLELVYQRPMRPELVSAFVAGKQATLWSGEFDALSYAFYRSAFEWVNAQAGAEPERTRTARHRFTQAVGQRFFAALLNEVKLALPQSLRTQPEFEELLTALQRLGRFLLEQGYLRTHFAFRFDVALAGERPIRQRVGDVVERLQRDRCAYALYEMGYPAILPSAVYLFNTLGEAQHHSSRTVEELFDRIGYRASESADFDPTGFSPDLVVELWEIRPRE
jgi:hypothetical protein